MLLPIKYVILIVGGVNIVYFTTWYLLHKLEQRKYYRYLKDRETYLTILQELKEVQEQIEREHDKS